jgi:hypothetical protein
VEADPPGVDTSEPLRLEKERLLNQLHDIVKFRRLLEISQLLGEPNLQLSAEKLTKHSTSGEQSSLTSPSLEQTGPAGSK